MRKELIFKRKPYQLTSEDQEIDHMKCEIMSYLKTSAILSRDNTKTDLEYPTLTNMERAKIEAVSGYYKGFKEENSVKTVLDPPNREKYLEVCEDYAKQIVRSVKNVPEMKNFTMKDKMTMTRNFINVFLALRYKFSFDLEKQHGLLLEIHEQKVCYRTSLSIWEDIIPEDLRKKWSHAMIRNKSVMLNDPVVRDLAITMSLFRADDKVSCPGILRLYYLEYYYLLRRYLQVKLKTREKFERNMVKFHDMLSAFPKMREFAQQFHELVSPHYTLELMTDVYKET